LFTIADTDDALPMWIETNKFTAPFQLLNDIYGFADYDEVHGGAFDSMYPFLLWIMFGDVRHSLFYLMAASAMIIATQRLADVRGMVAMLLGLRYFQLLMALCGISNGLISNE
jgi:vacuolar-type H+-ATPase subunit I/STV1